MTIIPSRLDQLETLTLDSGSHDDPGAEEWPNVHACVMEAVAFVAGEPWSDHPECASKVVGAFLRTWNDSLPDDDRQALKRYIPRLVGSAGTTEQEKRRAWMATDWLVRVHTPAWLRLAGLDADADALAALPELTPAEVASSITGQLEAARRNAAAAGAAAGDAARDAARAALAPTVAELQASAHDLVDRMLAVTE